MEKYRINVKKKQQKIKQSVDEKKSAEESARLKRKEIYFEKLIVH